MTLLSHFRVRKPINALQIHDNIDLWLITLSCANIISIEQLYTYQTIDLYRYITAIDIQNVYPLICHDLDQISCSFSQFRAFLQSMELSIVINFRGMIATFVLTDSKPSQTRSQSLSNAVKAFDGFDFVYSSNISRDPTDGSYREDNNLDHISTYDRRRDIGHKAHGIEISRQLTDASRGMTMRLYSTGIDQLNEILHGGIPCNRIVELLGPSGIGKTTICYHLAIATVLSSVGASGYRFLYIDTSNTIQITKLKDMLTTKLSIEMINDSHGSNNDSNQTTKERYKARYQDALSRLHIHKVSNMWEFLNYLTKLNNEINAK